MPKKKKKITFRVFDEWNNTDNNYFKKSFIWFLKFVIDFDNVYASSIPELEEVCQSTFGSFFIFNVHKFMFLKPLPFFYYFKWFLIKIIIKKSEPNRRN